MTAAFGRLCVETPIEASIAVGQQLQPPSGGCVLKLWKVHGIDAYEKTAAFGRLCVETL